MKLDALTIGAGAFAAFAAYAYLKTTKPATGQSAAAVVFGTAKDQRKQVGAATSQNYDLFGYKNESYQPNLAGMGGGQGLYSPSSGFWSIA